MKNLRWFSVFFVVFTAVSYGVAKTPAALPKGLRVDSSQPLNKVWENLTEKQKKLAYHLGRAASLGRTFIFYQSHRQSLAIRDLMVKSLAAENIGETLQLLGEPGFKEYLTYCASFLNQGGPYTNANRKFVLSQVTPQLVLELIRIYAPETIDSAFEITQLLTNPDFELQRSPEDESDDLKDAGGNIYERGITSREVKDAIAAGFVPKLNCRVVRRSDSLGCDIMTISSPGVVGKTLRAVVSELSLAKIYSSTEHQRKQIEALVRYFTFGDEQDFRNFNIEWVKDRADSTVDFMMGWVEVYDDWQSSIGSWESYVQVVDPEVSKIAQNLAKGAQHFEDNMPYGQWKKKFPADYAPPAIMVYYFQEIADARSGGYNLPNYDDIRRDYGAKNVIRLPLPGTASDPQLLAIRKEANLEYLPANKVDEATAEQDKVWQMLVLMHEIIGHGSGTYDEEKYPGKIDPIGALGKDTNGLAGALEEQRADQAALVFAGDEKWIDLGMAKDKADLIRLRNLMYDFYIGDFLRRLSKLRTFTEPHQRGHQVFINLLLEKGAIVWQAKDGQSPLTVENQVLAVKDYDLFHSVAVELLGQLQTLKANRDAQGVIALFTKYADLKQIDTDWAQAIIKRGVPLKINAGYVEQPWRITKDLKIETFGADTLESAAPFWGGYYR